MKDLNKMIEKFKKVFKGKFDQIQKHNKRRLGIKDRKRVVVKKIDDDKYDIL